MIKISSFFLVLFISVGVLANSTLVDLRRQKSELSSENIELISKNMELIKLHAKLKKRNKRLGIASAIAGTTALTTVGLGIKSKINAKNLNKKIILKKESMNNNEGLKEEEIVFKLEEFMNEKTNSDLIKHLDKYCKKKDKDGYGKPPLDYIYDDEGDEIANGSLTKIKQNQLKGMVSYILTHCPKIGRITIFKSEINDVSDITENLTNLTELSIFETKIKTIDVSKLTKLTTLYIAENELTKTTGISSLINLTALTISYNKLTALPNLSNLTKLKWLSVRNNQLTQLTDLSNLENLESLNVINNQLTSLPNLYNLINLSTICLYNNNLTKIQALSKLKNLNYLFVNDKTYDKETVNWINKWNKKNKNSLFVHEIDNYTKGKLNPAQ